MKVKIYYHHTDSGGVVYYANYLKFFEEARTEFFAERGLSIKELSGKGILFVVARQEVDYEAPAFYGDMLDVYASLAKVSGVRLEFEHRVNNQDGQLICKGKAVLVCVDKAIRPQPLPAEVKESLLRNPAK